MFRALETIDGVTMTNEYVDALKSMIVMDLCVLSSELIVLAWRAARFL